MSDQRRPYDPGRDEPMLSAYVDGELGIDDRAMVESWLEMDERARQEVDRLVQMKAFTDHLALRPAPREAWDDFHDRFSSRSTRGVGWTLLWVGVGIVGIYVAVRVVLVLLALAMPLIVRLGLLMVAIGLLTLLISAIRERVFAKKNDRYDDVVR
jgi:anti-sigma factor RsiW